MERVFTYKQQVENEKKDSISHIYVRYKIETKRRNPTLLCVPSMYVIAKGDKIYAGETYTKTTYRNGEPVKTIRQLNVGTIPRHRMTMPSMAQYSKPKFYDITVFADHILSPFNRTNCKLYKYKLTALTDGRTEILFMPKMYNTQLISGKAIADNKTGRLITIDMNGEFDMIKLRMRAIMGEEGWRSLFPVRNDISSVFSFIGNKITAKYFTVYNMDKDLPDSINNSHSMAMMDSIRPFSLPPEYRAIYDSYYSMLAANDSMRNEPKKKSKWKTIMWDILGDNIVNRISGKFGTQDQGSFRISPILNPLYLGYSKRKGLTYKFKIRGQYDFNVNRNITLNFRGGYSFKLKEFYYTIPLRLNFDKRHNGFMEFILGNGNRINNSSIVDKVKHTSIDSLDWDNMNLDYFKDFYVKTIVNYDISSRWSIQPGFITHRRSAVDRRGFIQIQQPTVYHSFAPTLQIQFRPWGWHGPVFTSDYERGIKGIGKASMDYERLEFDASWIYRINKIRSLSLRFGNGFYTSRSDNAYFLDYSNFRDDNLLGGWDDDWTGDFHLLNRNWYNVSEFYIRTNTTYESPLLIASRLPLVGRFIETERLYISTLFVEHLHPYVEYGYGFTNRLFSMGLFVATSNTHFEGFGCRFGFELFNRW